MAESQLVAQLSQVLGAGAEFTFGNPVLVTNRVTKKIEEEQPVFGACRGQVASVYDGGAWIALTTTDGLRVRTATIADAENLRQLMKAPETVRPGIVPVHVNKVVFVDGN